MNLLSLAKLFTVVLSVLFIDMNFAKAAGASSEAGEKGYFNCIEGANASAACTADPESAKCKILVSRCEAGRNQSGAANEAKEAKLACKDAMKEWRDKASKGTRACAAFDKSLGETCSEKIRGCQGKIDGAFGSEFEEGSETAGLLRTILMSKIGTKSNDIGNDALTGGTACVKQYDAKTKKEDTKEYNKERRELEEKVKKQKDEAAKLNEKLREKINDITEKINALDAENKKDGLKRETKMREETTRLSKSTVDIGKKLRTLDLQIVAVNQKLSEDRFAYQTSLLDLTTDRITENCRQQVLMAKSALLGGAAAGASADQKQQLAALSSQILQGGIKGTANLNTQLKKIKEKCFEQENTKKKQIQMQASKGATNGNNQIKTIQDDIADEKKQLELDKQSLAAVKAEAEKEGNTAEAEKLKKVENLNSEMTNFQDSTNEKLKIAGEEARKLNEEIENLKLKKDFDVEPAFDDALDAITTSEASRVNAVEACNCDKEESSNNCTMLKEADIEEKPGTGRSKTKSKK